MIARLPSLWHWSDHHSNQQSSPAILVKACRLLVPQKGSPLIETIFFQCLQLLCFTSSRSEKRWVTFSGEFTKNHLAATVSSGQIHHQPWVLHCTACQLCECSHTQRGPGLASGKTRNTTLQSHWIEDSILTQAKGWSGVRWEVGAGKRRRKKMVPFCSLWVSPKGEKLNLGMLYLLWVFVKFEWVNISESIWKQRCVFIIAKIVKGQN